MLPETKVALASGTCFVAEEVDASPVAARIEIRKQIFREPLSLIRNLLRMADSVKEIQVLKIFAAEQGRWPLKFQKTRVRYSYWSMPLYVSVTEVGSIERTLNDFDPIQVAVRTLGIKDLPADR
jgi:hypothetical protein